MRSFSTASKKWKKRAYKSITIVWLFLLLWWCISWCTVHIPISKPALAVMTTAAGLFVAAEVVEARSYSSCIWLKYWTTKCRIGIPLTLFPINGRPCLNKQHVSVRIRLVPMNHNSTRFSYIGANMGSNQLTWDHNIQGCHLCQWQSPRDTWQEMRTIHHNHWDDTALGTKPQTNAGSGHTHMDSALSSCPSNVPMIWKDIE